MKKLQVLLSMLMAVSFAASGAGGASYAGQQARDIKALSETEIAGLLAGHGLGYAKAAELNGYPGPRHVLDLAEELALDDGQREQTQALFEQMQAAAKDLGAELVEAERELDTLFRSKTVDESSLWGATAKIAGIEGRLREVHLRAHLRQIQLLDENQIARYMMLRGYVGGGPEGHQHHHGNQH